MPKIESFSPREGGPGDEIHIFGVNFSTATAVTFGGKAAESFEIVSDGEIAAVVSQYGATGKVAVTNHKGTKELAGFVFIKPQETEDPNMALGKPVSASSENRPATNITDGSDNLWQAQSTGTEWVIIDLGKVCRFNKFVICWDPGASATAFEILVSDDSENFTSVYSTDSYNALAGAGDGIQTIFIEEAIGRYVKILMTKCINIWNYSIKEVEIYREEAEPVEEKVNLALGKTATVSSITAGIASNLTDGTDHLWQAGSAEPGEWAMVDLGENKTINNVVLTVDPGACAVEFDLQVSTDGENFTTVINRTDYSPSYDGGVCNLIFPDCEARYVKLFMKKCINIWHYTIKEFEVYKLPAMTNVALEKSASASSENTPASRLTDGSDALWQAGSAEENTEWVKIDLGAPTKINTVLLNWDGLASATAYDVLVSSDDAEYTKVFGTEGYDYQYDGGMNYIYFSELETRYVKVELKKCYSIYSYSLKEVEIYNYK
ncbi:MAG: discoidin domain-containing protein [Candidatus Cryptobacteroides sp.]